MKLMQEEIYYINRLDSVTGVMAKDCIITDNSVTFAVNPGEVAKAIGKNGKNTKILSKEFGKKVEVFALPESVEEFLKAAFPNAKFNNIEKKDNAIAIKFEGDGRRNFMEHMGKFKKIKKVVERNYKITEIRF